MGRTGKNRKEFVGQLSCRRGQNSSSVGAMEEMMVSFARSPRSISLEHYEVGDLPVNSAICR